MDRRIRGKNGRNTKRNVKPKESKNKSRRVKSVVKIKPQNPSRSLLEFFVGRQTKSVRAQVRRQTHDVLVDPKIGRKLKRMYRVVKLLNDSLDKALKNIRHERTFLCQFTIMYVPDNYNPRIDVFLFDRGTHKLVINFMDYLRKHIKNTDLNKSEKTLIWEEINRVITKRSRRYDIFKCVDNKFELYAELKDFIDEVEKHLIVRIRAQR